VLITFEYSNVKKQSKKDEDQKTHKLTNGDIVAVADENTTKA
jgi:hypothetical protein